MAYSDFTLAKVREAFNLTLEENHDLFADVPAIPPSDRLKLILEENIPLAIAINSEKARSEFLIAPILSEVRRQLSYKISLFSGIDFNVEPSQGLNVPQLTQSSATSKKLIKFSVFYSPLSNLV